MNEDKTYKLHVPEKDMIKAYVKIIGSVVTAVGLSKERDFTKNELDVLAEFIQIHLDLPFTPELVFSASMREKVRLKLKLSKSNLGNYISFLMKKGAVLQGPTRINPRILPEIDKSGNILLSFILRPVNEETR